MSRRVGNSREGKRVVEANTPLKLLVARNVSDDAFKVTDRGRTRTVGDLASILNISNPHHAAAVGRRICSNLYVWSGRTTDFTVDRLLSADQLVDFMWVPCPEEWCEECQKHKEAG